MERLTMCFLIVEQEEEVGYLLDQGRRICRMKNKPNRQ